MASCRRSQSYLVFFLTNKEHEQEEVVGGETKRNVRTKLKTGMCCRTVVGIMLDGLRVIMVGSFCPKDET